MQSNTRMLAVTRARLAGRPFNVGTAVAELVLPEDLNRVYFLIQNNSSANLLVGLDAAPANARQCIVLGPGNFWEPNVIPVNSVYVLSASLTNAAGICIFGTLGGLIQ